MYCCFQSSSLGEEKKKEYKLLFLILWGWEYTINLPYRLIFLSQVEELSD